MSTRIPYRCTFKNSARGRNVRSMVRFYESDEMARTDWAKQVADMTNGRGVVLSVDPDQNPALRAPHF